VGPVPARGIAAPPRLRVTDVPLFGPLEVPSAAEEEGPPDGLTLDAAIDRLVRDNLFLEARRWEIPATRADVITAGLRANPVLFADGQLVPYSQYNRTHPGGPNQYDLNVSHPIDYSGKRLAREAAAWTVLSVQEALYLNAVRIEIDNLYVAFLNVVATRETVRYARASQAGLRRLLGIYETLYRQSDVTRADVGRVNTMVEAADLAVTDSEELLRRYNRTLGALLNLPPDQAVALQVRGRLADLAPPPPPTDELVRIALAERPDLVAQRLGVGRAEAGVRLARANRFGDAYLLYQPYTFQNNMPSGLKSATSWALGVTAPLPVYNRNQGGVARARLNVEQTLVELAAVERRVAAEVIDAGRRYKVSRERLRKIEQDVLPAARSLRDDTLELFVSGELTAIDANNAQKEYNQAVRQYRDALISHRRSMFELNTAVARRVLP
jgi:cobalt-zinc-cadmium efflux system outer membrane protein